MATKKTIEAQDRRHFFTVALFPDGPPTLEAMGLPASEEVTDREQQDAFAFHQYFIQNDALRAAVTNAADWMIEYFGIVEGLPPDMLSGGRDTYIRFAEGLVAVMKRKGVVL